MRVAPMVERVLGFCRFADRALYLSMICRTAEERHTVLASWERHSLAARRDASTSPAACVARETRGQWRQRRRARPALDAPAPRAPPPLARSR